MHRLLLLATALLVALPAQAQRVTTQSVREALDLPDVRTSVRSSLRATPPTAEVVAAHEIAPAHLADATSDDGPDERVSPTPRALLERISADRARAILADVEADIPGIDLRATPGRATPERATPGRVTPGRVQTPGQIQSVPGRVTPGRVNPGQTPGSVAQPQGPQLDVLGFCAALHNALKDNANGYVMRLAQNGQPIATLQWSWARRPGEGNKGWNPQRRMHVASVSKLITAIAAVDLLHDKNISWDATIGQYLPAYWDRGANVNNITFRELLTHMSGIEVPGSSTNYATMKAEIAAGVPATVTQSQYENVNFALFRVLIPIINGDVDRNALITLDGNPMFQSIMDNWWDVVTVNAYQAYVNQHVFVPSGIGGGPGLTHTPNDAIAYGVPWTSGWDSGNLRSVAGGAGWVMSADQVLSVMAHYRHTNAIVPSTLAQQAMDARLGLDVKSNTPAGTLYNKNGRWNGNGRSEQSLAYFLPNGMELVVLTNSPITPLGDEGKGVFFRGLVTDLYLANLD